MLNGMGAKIPECASINIVINSLQFINTTAGFIKMCVPSASSASAEPEGIA